MTDIIQNPSKTLAYRTKRVVPLNSECPNCQALLRGRKGAAREEELLTAEQIASDYRKRKVSGIYRRRP